MSDENKVRRKRRKKFSAKNYRIELLPPVGGSYDKKKIASVFARHICKKKRQEVKPCTDYTCE